MEIIRINPKRRNKYKQPERKDRNHVNVVDMRCTKAFALRAIMIENERRKLEQLEQSQRIADSIRQR